MSEADYMRKCEALTEVYPDNHRIVVDGKTYVVRSEVIAGFAFGSVGI